MRFKLVKEFKTVLRRTILPAWENVEWLVIAALAVAAVTLGYCGFSQYFDSLGQVRSKLDCLYLSLQLFTLESGSIAGAKPWELEAARFMAPALAAYTAIQALMVIFARQLQLLKLYTLKNHIIICGLGRKGYLLSKEFLHRGYQVVVIDKNENDDLIQLCRDSGANVIIGDAIHSDLLKRANPHKAKYLFAVSGDDGVNAEVVIHAMQICNAKKSYELICYVHITDPRVYALLHDARRGMRGDKIQLCFFNTFATGARVLLQKFPFTNSANPHIMIVGLGRMGQNLLVQAIEEWRNHNPKSKKKLKVTLIDRESEEKVQSIKSTNPHILKYSKITFFRFDIRWLESFKNTKIFNTVQMRDVTMIYICFDDNSLCLRTALILSNLLKKRKIPIIARMTTETGFAALINDKQGFSGFQNIYTFGLLDQTCSPECIVDIHENN